MSGAARGTIIAGQYRLLETLGVGGMGIVWRAHRLGDSSELAIKLINADREKSWERSTSRFLREAQAAASLRSPHVVSVVDYGVDEGTPFIAMELLRGRTLAELLRCHRFLSPRETAQILGDVALGLARAHQADIVHRDLKPPNIFLVQADELEIAKILDFGIAKSGDPEIHGSALTQTGVALGTPQYMSPEQIRGAKDVDHRADLWSFAVIAYQCLVGRLPFDGDTSGAIHVAVCTGNALRPSSIAPVPRGFDAWFSVGVHADIERRFSSILAMQNRLREVCAQDDRDGSQSIVIPRAPETVTEQQTPVPRVRPTPSPGAVEIRLVVFFDEDSHTPSPNEYFAQSTALPRALVCREVLRFGGRLLCDDPTELSVSFRERQSAIRAAISAQKALLRQRHGTRGVRMALEADADANQRPPLVRRTGAARVCSVGHPGQILLSAATRAAFEEDFPESIELLDLGEHLLTSDDTPIRLYQLQTPDSHREFGPLRTTPVAPNNLPRDATELVGRAQQLAEIRELLSTHRLVTLVGPVGVGKSGLALQAARDQLDRGELPDGVYFVPLAPVRDLELVVPAIASAINIGIESVTANRALTEALGGASMLLVLDNFEQVLPAAKAVVELLQAAPKLRCLVTSRTRLGVRSEAVVQVLPLELPRQEDISSTESLAKVDSVALFERRARSVDPTFSVTAQNAAAVADIVERLEGLPLAIELAAARCDALTPMQVSRRLGKRFDLLRGGNTSNVLRHRTLRNAIGWSYELLEKPEQALMRRLAVFTGGFRLVDAERVAGGAPVVEFERGLERLLESNVLRRSSGAGAERFWMLECIREFGLEELTRAGEERRIGEAHAQVFFELAEEVAPKLKCDGSIETRQVLAIEDGNLNVALRFCLLHRRVDDAIGTCATIWRYWQSTGRFAEGRRWLVELLACPEGSVTSRVQGLGALAGLAYWQADYETALGLYKEALVIYRQLGDQLRVAEMLASMSTTSTWNGDPESGERLAADALTLFQSLGVREQVGLVRMAQGFARWKLGDLAGARPLWNESIAIAREVGDDEEAAHKALALASITFLEGREKEAVAEAILAMSELFERNNVSLTVMAVGFVGAMTVKSNAALGFTLAEAAAELRKFLGGGMRPEACGLPDTAQVAATTLSKKSMSRIRARVRRWDLAQAVRVAHTA